MDADILAPDRPHEPRGDAKMPYELDITLRGPHAGMDAVDTLKAMDALLRLLKELERTETQGRGRGRGTRWTFTQLGLGSTKAALAPLEIPEDSGYEQLDRIMNQAVAGFAAAETAPVIPPDWTAIAARLGGEVARTLGASPDVGMHIALRAGERTVREAEVTQRAHRNLRSAVTARYTAVGSRRGHLGGLSDARRKVRAVLWAEVGHERIPLICGEEHREALRRAWGRDRVEIIGRITENAQGQVVSIAVDEIELLPVEPALSSDDLSGGFWPDMTGGVGALGFMAVIRGEA